MKLADEFVSMALEDEMILVPVGKAAETFHGIVRLNETGAFIVERLKQDTTPPEIVDALLSEYTVERAVAERHVDALLQRLREVGAIVE